MSITVYMFLPCVQNFSQITQTLYHFPCIYKSRSILEINSSPSSHGLLLFAYIYISVIRRLKQMISTKRIVVLLLSAWDKIMRIKKVRLQSNALHLKVSYVLLSVLVTNTTHIYALLIYTQNSIFRFSIHHSSLVSRADCNTSSRYFSAAANCLFLSSIASAARALSCSKKWASIILWTGTSDDQ